MQNGWMIYPSAAPCRGLFVYIYTALFFCCNAFLSLHKNQEFLDTVDSTLPSVTDLFLLATVVLHYPTAPCNTTAKP